MYATLFDLLRVNQSGMLLKVKRSVTSYLDLQRTLSRHGKLFLRSCAKQIR